MKIALGVLGFIVFVAVALAQLGVGFAGIQDGIGTGWAYAALILAFVFRFTVPITIGAFFGAMNVLGWHWLFALLFAAPGLFLIVPGFFASIFSLVKR
jgi:hypothetical protein